eukprot:COSAG06_NODE_12296_length_1398_cov_2.313318_2_plen_203_part_00
MLPEHLSVSIHRSPGGSARRKCKAGRLRRTCRTIRAVRLAVRGRRPAAGIGELWHSGAGKRGFRVFPRGYAPISGLPARGCRTAPISGVYRPWQTRRFRVFPPESAPILDSFLIIYILYGTYIYVPRYRIECPWVATARARPRPGSPHRSVRDRVPMIMRTLPRGRPAPGHLELPRRRRKSSGRDPRCKRKKRAPRQSRASC